MSVLAVGIDVAAVPAEVVGAGQYTVELVRSLGGRGDVALTLLCRRDDAVRWRSVAPSASVLARAPARRVPRLVWEEVGLAAETRRSGRSVEVLHGPHYSLPAFPGRPCVVTVHDLTFVDHPEWHERSKVAYFRRALRLAARRARVVVCVSERTAERYRELFAPRVPVRVIPHGVDHHRFSPLEPHRGADAEVLDRLGVRPPYVLHTGTIQPRKDLVSLVAAFDGLAELDGELSLVLAGGRGWGTERLDGAISRSRSRGRIRLLGHVADSDVPALVRRAAVVAYPSLEEGFGLPALEALACGTPLVTTEGTAMADVAGGAAALVPPSDPGALAAAIDGARRGGREVEDRRGAGLAVASRFTWDECAARHVDAYRAAAGR
ncbi:MAG: glycosyltransferase family 1 protein [Actinomycetota bacterium]|nr:glycosyltransferase family 1 protein [Actinomycetota bacterium]